MPTIQIGSKSANIDGGAKTVKLRKDNPEIHFRIANNPYYSGKHFLENVSKWDVVLCDRINEGLSCKLCEKFFEAKLTLKEKKETADEAIIEDLERQIKRYKPTVNFYYPILDRKNECASVFETTISVRNKIDEEAKVRDVTKFDYICRITGNTGADYYSLTRLDSQEIVPFNEKEIEEYDKAKSIDIAGLLESKAKKSTHSIIEEDEESLTLD